jgi:putative cardiolipin synthase
VARCQGPKTGHCPDASGSNDARIVPHADDNFAVEYVCDDAQTRTVYRDPNIGLRIGKENMMTCGQGKAAVDRRRWSCLPVATQWVIFALAVGGCASLPTDYPRDQASALSETADTRLGRAVTSLQIQRPQQSGFHPLVNGLDAFVARLALIEAAERSLDVQYYLFHADVTGRLLTDYLLQAADRGVRVRLLLDDMDMAGRDAGLAALTLHPMIDVRLFNPFPSRQMRFLDFLAHFGTVTRRMHNKSFTADNQAAIVGGRNVGDAYFAAAEGINFGDMDVLAVGLIVRDVSDAFDRYWNSEQVMPVSALGTKGDPKSLEVARARLAEERAALADSTYAKRLRASDLAQRIEARELEWFWGPAQLLYDLPEKVSTNPDDRSTHLGPELADLLTSVQTDLFLISPYFVPGKPGTDLLRALVERGVRVTILTNSLAATDVPIVHAGYARYRTSLVEAGVELYEVRPSLQSVNEDKRRTGSSQASLHAKTLVFDDRRVLVGSMNLDPRSSLLNTEMGIVIDSPAFAEKVTAWRDRELQQLAWRVEQENVPGVYAEQTRLVWVGVDAGREVRRADREPDAGFWARIQATLARVLPIEQQL